MQTLIWKQQWKNNGKDSNHVTVDEADVPKHLQSSLTMEVEILQQYRTVSSYMVYGRSVMMNISMIQLWKGIENGKIESVRTVRNKRYRYKAKTEERHIDDEWENIGAAWTTDDDKNVGTA